MSQIAYWPILWSTTINVPSTLEECVLQYLHLSFYIWSLKVKIKKVKLLSPTLCDPKGCTCQAPPWDFPGKITGLGCHFLLQGIIPIQRSNPGLLHCRHTLNPLSHKRAYLVIRSSLLTWHNNQFFTSGGQVY